MASDMNRVTAYNPTGVTAAGRKVPPTRRQMLAGSFWMILSWFVLLGVLVIFLRLGRNWFLDVLLIASIGGVFWWFGLYGVACLIAAMMPGRSRDVACPGCGSLMRVAPAAVEARCGGCLRAFNVRSSVTRRARVLSFTWYVVWILPILGLFAWSLYVAVRWLT